MYDVLQFMDLRSNQLLSSKKKFMQKIKKCNSFIDYIPCIAHSLNLVGQSAVDCCVEAVSFFGFVQEVYNFFSASTQRWDIFKKNISKKLSGS